jgi:hypothetical protein
MTNRGVHLTRTLNINTPIDGVYPFGDSTLRELTESNGFSRTNQLIFSPNVSYKKFFLFGFYALSYGKDDNEGAPANPYDLKAEWGPSTYANVRQRGVIGTNIPLPLQFSISPFLILSSGTPYNITTGVDSLDEGVAAERPSLSTNVTAANCTGTGFKYETGYGCFNLNPAPGAAIGRNYGVGPGNETLMLRLARTWAFGPKGRSSAGRRRSARRWSSGGWRTDDDGRGQRRKKIQRDDERAGVQRVESHESGTARGKPFVAVFWRIDQPGIGLRASWRRRWRNPDV